MIFSRITPALTSFAFYISALLTASYLCGREEWAWLQSHVYTTANGSVQNLLSSKDESLMENSEPAEFVRSLRAAVTHLLTKLNIPLYRVKMISNSQLEIEPSEAFWKEKTGSELVFILFGCSFFNCICCI